jgi:fructokinase
LPDEDRRDLSQTRYFPVKGQQNEESQSSPMTQNKYPEQSAPPAPNSLANRKRTVVLFGEVLADIFPDRSVLGGAPFNVARHLRAFGQNPVLITRLGHDALRDKVMQAMSQYEMETLGVQCNNHHPTGQVRVHLKDGGHHFEILPMQAYDFIHPAMVRMTALSLRPALVYYGTLAQRHEVSRRALKSLLRSTDAPKFLDINLRAPWYDKKTLRQSLQYADIVKLNDDELEVIAEMFELSESKPENRVNKLMHQFDLERVVVTCGDEGAWQADPDGKIIEAVVRDPITRLVDTVGAGDGFASVWILGALLHWPAAKTLDRANAFAAAICGIRGALPDHADFYQPYKRAWGV